MLQAIGEGINLLEGWPQSRLESGKILECWSHGSVIRSWLIELLRDALQTDAGPSNIPAFIEDTGEVNWLISDALHLEIPIPVIAQSVFQLFSSRDNEKKWAKAISAMRHGFFGPPSKPIEEERRTGRLSDAFMD